MSYLIQYDYPDLQSKIQNDQQRLNEVEKLIQELLIEQKELQERIEQNQNVINQQQYRMNCFEEFDSHQPNLMNNEIEYDSEFSNKFQYPFYHSDQQNGIQGENLLNNNPNSLFPHSSDLYEDPEPYTFNYYNNHKMDYQEQHQEQNKIHTINNVNEQINVESQENEQKENQFKINFSCTSKIQQEQINENEKQKELNIKQENLETDKPKPMIVIKYEDKKSPSPGQKVLIIPRYDKISESKDKQPADQINCIQQLNTISGGNNSFEKNNENGNKYLSQENQNMSTPKFKKVPSNVKFTNIVIQTPSSTSDTQFEEEIPNLILKIPPKQQKIKKDKQQSKNQKKCSTKDTTKLCKYQNQYQYQKTSSFNKDKSNSNDSKPSSNKTTNLLDKMDDIKPYELINIKKSQLSEIKIIQENDSQKNQNLLQIEQQEKQKQIYFEQKEKMIENLPDNPALKSKFIEQIEYIQEIIEKKLLQEGCENYQGSPKEQQPILFQKKGKQQKEQQQQKTSQMISHNNLNTKQYQNLKETDTEGLKMKKKQIKEQYKLFLKDFIKSKSKYPAKEKGYFRYPSNLKMKIVEFSKYMRLIQIQKDTSISQETIRKWQKRYTNIPEKIMQFDIMS